MNNLDDLHTISRMPGEAFASISSSSRKDNSGSQLSMFLWKWSFVVILVLIQEPGLARSQTQITPSMRFSSPTGSGQVSFTDMSMSDHGEVLAAGFGFQGAASSMITIRTYQAASGVVLSEDSYDLNVLDDGMRSGRGPHGRIFAGGIGLDSSGQSKFLLRVYDAATGKFLWEGQLNLRSQGEESVARPTASLVPIRPSTWLASAKGPSAIQAHLSLRAVDPRTGGLVWEDKFIPGSHVRGRAEGIVFQQPSVSGVENSIGHVFDLVVLTFDRLSGRLLWRDSFEELDQIDRRESEQDSEVQPQALPPWGEIFSRTSTLHQTSTRGHYDF